MMRVLYECLKCHCAWGPGENLPITCPECGAAGEAACEHGTALDVHCCNCHSGFIFDHTRCVCGGNQQPLPGAVAKGESYCESTPRDPECASCSSLRERTEAAEAREKEARAEIAAAREACPIVRRQDYFDAPLLTLIELEISALFAAEAQRDEALTTVQKMEAERGEMLRQLRIKETLRAEAEARVQELEREVAGLQEAKRKHEKNANEAIEALTEYHRVSNLEPEK